MASEGQVKSIGPHGGRGGSSWDDGKDYFGVKQIEIAYDSRVHSIRVEYDEYGSSVWHDRRGGDGGKKTPVTFQHPNEYLISVSGYLIETSSGVSVQSLTFHTDQKRYGPYGNEEGMQFSLSSGNDIIIGFHGRSGAYLDSIGAYFVPNPNGSHNTGSNYTGSESDGPQVHKLTSFGPFGGNGGFGWDDGMDYTGVKQIVVAHDSVIHSIRIEYDDTGSSVWSSIHGGAEGSKTHVKFDYPNEYLVSVCGYHSETSSGVVQSLTFKTNKKSHGPYGLEKGKYFSISPSNGKIIGFHGRSGAYLDCIGAHFESNPNSSKNTDSQNTGSEATTDANESQWDDGTHTNVKSLKIAYGFSAVYSITTEYDKAGNSFWAPKRGGNGGEQFAEIKLTHSGEYLISVTGYYTTVNSEQVIRSMKFKSNRRTYGSFGMEAGSYFAIIAPKGNKIVGLKGKSENFLNGIEAHFELLLSHVSSVGPFGGSGGCEWDDGKEHSGVRQIKIGYNKHINSIQVQYDDEIWSDSRGGEGSDERKESIKFHYPDEYLSSVSGYYGSPGSDVVVQSLTVQSNKKTYGPFGIEKGRYFSLSSPNKKIVGFHGRSGTFLDSIGAHVVPLPESYVSVGPFGGSEGVFWDDGEHTGIRQIKLVYASVINSITVQYDDNGSSTWAAKHGGNNGTKTETVNLEYPNEFLISVAGYILNNKVYSLTLESNKRRYGPFGPRTEKDYYGIKTGIYFSFPSFPSKIVGFFGSSESFLNSIGAHVKQNLLSYEPFYIAPLGGTDGYHWDDGAYTSVRKIEIGYDTVIDFICVEYDSNGSSVWCARHGANLSSKTHTVELDFPSEYIISITGHIRTKSPMVIQSLTIETNMKKHGPFGTQHGYTFSLGSSGSKIIGFHGRAGASLDAIGVYTRRLLLATYERSKMFGPPESGSEIRFDGGVNTDIRKIEISSGPLGNYTYVNSLCVEYDQNGRRAWSEQRGQGTTPKTVIKLDYPNEYIISVSGRHNPALYWLRSFSFETNKKKYGPFGVEDGKLFTIAQPNSKIVGLYGKSGVVVDAIGAYMVPLTNPCSEPPYFGELLGGSGGNRWDDGVYDAVKRITIGQDDDGFPYIGFVYEKNGETMLEVGHGDRPFTNPFKIKLDTPNEFLISVSGFYDYHPGVKTPFIKSLKFQTNKRTFGPYGRETGDPFSSAESVGKIVGFHGRTGWYLDAIGVYTRPVVD